MKKPRELLLSFGLLTLIANTDPIWAQATYGPWKASVMASAEVLQSPLRVKLDWNPNAGSGVTVTGFNIWRKLPSETQWGSSIASLGPNATEWEDNTVQANSEYEYKIERLSNSLTGYGYLAVSVGSRMAWNRGRIILLVDDAF